MTLNEVAPPGFGHTKGDKEKGVKKGGTAAAFDRARKEGRFKGSKSDMFAIMWSQKIKAAQKGEMENPSPEVADVANDISVKDAKKFAKTKHKGLPEKKKMQEGISFTGWRKKASSIMKKTATEKKPEKAMDAGARAKRKLQRKVHATYVSGSEDNVPDEIRD